MGREYSTAIRKVHVIFFEVFQFTQLVANRLRREGRTRNASAFRRLPRCRADWCCEPRLTL